MCAKLDGAGLLQLEGCLKDVSCCRLALTTRQVVVGFQGLSAGVAYMRRRVLVDQDLHPGNILLSSKKSTLVKADLGSAVPQEVHGCQKWLEDIM